MSKTTKWFGAILHYTKVKSSISLIPPTHPCLVIDILFLACFQEVQSGEQLVGFMLVKSHSYWVELIYRKSTNSLNLRE